MSARQEQLRAGLSRFLSDQWQSDAAATDLVHIPGGASRETWRFQAQGRGMVVRIDPESSLVDTDRRTEFRVVQGVFRAGLPVPEPLFLVEDDQWLGRPFSISAEVTGCQASAEALPSKHLETIGQEKWTLLGRIAGLDPVALGLDDVMTPTKAETCALEQLDYWAGVIADDEIEPNPVAAAAVRWLRRRPPPPAQKIALVHGDYRTGNFLFTPAGEIRAILDWEMAHLGDPLEDLAWSLDPLWSWRSPALAGRLLPHARAISAWEAASGLKVDRAALHWWRVFASLKAIAIWISSSRDFHSQASKPLILAVAGWVTTDRQQRILLDYLSPHSRHRFAEIFE